MNFSAKSVLRSGSSKAPEDYWTLPELIEVRPRIKNTETSLQLLDGSNVVAWYVRGEDAIWRPGSEFFLVVKNKPTGRGVRYDAKKEAFLAKYPDDIETIVVKQLPFTHPHTQAVIAQARKEIGYSPRTASIDILRFLEQAYKALPNKNPN